MAHLYLTNPMILKRNQTQILVNQQFYWISYTWIAALLNHTALQNVFFVLSHTQEILFVINHHVLCARCTMYMDQRCNMCVVKTSGNTTDIVCMYCEMWVKQGM